MLMRPKHSLVRPQALNVNGDLAQSRAFYSVVTAYRASKFGLRSYIKME
jgi:hypothetical protein